MLSNRSIPSATVIPVLAYPDVNQAAAWLCDAFGFSVRLRIGNHRVQLNVARTRSTRRWAWDTRSLFVSRTSTPTATGPRSTERGSHKSR